MKRLKIILCSFLLPISLYGAALDQAELERVTMDLLSGLTPEEQEVVMKQAMEMDKYINSLPPEERKKLEAELEKELQGLMETGVLDDLSRELKAERAQPQPVQPIQPEKPIKEDKKPTISTKVPEVQASMRTLSSRITDLLLKAENNVRVSTNPVLEQAWTNMHQDLLETQSYILVIAHNNVVANALLTDEFSQLHDQLTSFSDKLSTLLQSVKKEKIDKNSVVERYNIDALISFVEDALNNKKLLWNIKRLIQKHAPEEIKEKPKSPVKKLEEATKPATGVTVQGSSMPRYGQPRRLPQQPSPAMRPSVIPAGIGSQPGSTQKTATQGEQAGSRLPQPPAAQRSGDKAGQENKPSGSSAARSGSGSTSGEAKKGGERASGSGKPAAAKSPFDIAFDNAKKLLADESLSLSKKLKDNKLATRIKEYIEKDGSGIEQEAMAIMKDLTDMQLTNRTLFSHAQTIRNQFLEKIERADKEKFKKERDDLAKKLDPKKGRLKELKEQLNALTKAEGARAELKALAQQVKDELSEIENKIKEKIKK